MSKNVLYIKQKLKYVFCTSAWKVQNEKKKYPFCTHDVDDGMYCTRRNTYIVDFCTCLSVIKVLEKEKKYKFYNLGFVCHLYFKQKLKKEKTL